MPGHRWTRAAVPLLGLCLLTIQPGPAADAAAVHPSVSDRAATPVLTSMQAHHTGSVDRVVFRFTGGVPASVQASWEDTLIGDGSGLPIRVAGAKVLSVVMHGAVAHQPGGGSTIAARTAFALPNVITAVGAGDFEGVVSIGLGVQKKTSFQVRKLADRVVVDVGAAFPTSTRKVWFVNQQANVASVSRRVPAAAPAAGVLQSLFAGPKPSEAASGLRLVRSGAWGFDHLSIAGGIARLRLTKGCRSGGSTTTVANEIVPTLKQFPSVDWVKISSPGGQTEQPSGPSDSIPTCLEP
jgi:hypothetical protein